MKLTKTNEEISTKKYIQTYKSTPNQRVDMDDYTDADGKLHRNTLPHTSTKAEFTTIPMYLAQWDEFMSLLERNYDDPQERKVNVEYFDFETRTYKQGVFYVPDFTVEVRLMYRDRNDMLINSVRFAIIEY